MIAEIVTFEIKGGMRREEVAAHRERSPQGWRAILHLLHESCLHGAVGAPRGGVHVRKSAEAHDAHGGACKARIAGAFGSAPAFGYFETAVVVGNRTNADAAPAA
jgi:hypothetical protein